MLPLQGGKGPLPLAPLEPFASNTATQPGSTPFGAANGMATLIAIREQRPSDCSPVKTIDSLNQKERPAYSI
jgi:hypothetical protein